MLLKHPAVISESVVVTWNEIYWSAQLLILRVELWHEMRYIEALSCYFWECSCVFGHSAVISKSVVVTGNEILLKHSAVERLSINPRETGNLIPELLSTFNHTAFIQFTPPI